MKISFWQLLALLILIAAVSGAIMRIIFVAQNSKDIVAANLNKQDELLKPIY